MDGGRRKTSKTFHSTTHFEKEYLPNYFAKKTTEKPSNHALGAALAKESLEKVKKGLAR